MLKLIFPIRCLIVRSIINKLGPERISKVKIVGNEEVRQSLYSQVVIGQAKHSGLDEQLAKEAMKAGSPFPCWLTCFLLIKF